MKRIATIVIIVVVLAGGFFLFRRFTGQQASANSAFQTTPAQRGSLTASVGATGVVYANQSVVLGWQTSGIVDQVNAKVGDQVTKDQVLANLQPTSLPQNIILAQADLVNAQKTLKDLYDTSLALAQAEQKVAAAQDNVKNKQDALDSLKQPARQVDIDQAQANVTTAKIQLDKARENFQPYENKPEDNPVRANLYSRYVQAQQNYDSAVRLLNNLQGTASDLSVSVAEADLKLAQAQLEDAQKQYDDLKAGPDAVDVTNAKTKIEAAQATLDLARIAAPFEGMITDVQTKPGDQVNAGSTAFRIDDLSHLLVDVQVSEVDINSVQVGQDASLTFDAITNKTYTGKVTKVALVGNANQGVVDFTVTVELTNADDPVKPGMTAGVNIVVQQLKDVLLVPNRAVRVVNGNRVVYILKDGAPQAVNITLGASSDTDSQVVGGDLKEGDPIVLNPPLTFDQNGPPPFAGQSR
jgi:HlyD family secretion protein